MVGSAFEPIRIPDHVWRDAKTLALLESRDVGGLFLLAKQWAGASQNRLAAATGIPQPRVNALMKRTGGPIEKLEVFERIADGLNMPDHARTAMGLAPRTNVVPAVRGNAGTPASKISTLAAGITDSDTSNDAIEQLARATTSLAESHTQVPAKTLIIEVLRLHDQAATLLARRLRLSQTRELFHIESHLLAHACLLYGDLQQNSTADQYGTAALLYAKEAGANQAIAWTARAKTLRWQGRLIESADMARRGFECSPPTPVRIQLASQEANAAALLGDTGRAQEAMQRAEEATQTVQADSGTSAWSFSAARQAIFALSVAIHTGDPDAALRAAQKADIAWKSGTLHIPATWAQIRAGAGIAHLIKGSLDGTIKEVTPVLTLPPELRVATVTGYLEDLNRRLEKPPFRYNKDAIALQQQIRDFNAAAPTVDPRAENE